MKLLSLVRLLSLTSILTGTSLTAIAETVSHDRNSNNSSENTARVIEDRAANLKNDKYPVQQQLSDRNNSQAREKSVGYDVFSVAKDIEITLNNVGQDLDLEDVEWYIEKYPQQ